VSWWNDKIIFTGITGGQVINIGIGKFYSTAAIAADRSISATHVIGTFGEEIGKLILNPGSGTSDKPFLIYSEADLRAMGRGNYKGMNWTTSAHYKLRSDFDLTGKGDWVPIGLGSSGVFDGNGHTITGLTINGTESYQGMFTRVSGKVENLRLENVNINNTLSYTGAIAGENCGTISNCSASGSVSSSSSAVGGLVGANWGISSIIQNSFSAVNVTGSSTSVGGIAGFSHNSGGTIRNCYSTGTVTGGEAGGIVGQQGPPLSNCFAAGAVSSSTGQVGGIAAYISSACNVEGSIALNQSITRTGGTSAVFGRIVGIVDAGGTLTNNRAWSGIPFNFTGTPGNALDNIDGLGVTAAELRTQATWTAAGFAFGDSETSPWVWQEGRMPRLYWQSENLPWPEHLVDPVTVTNGTTTTPYASLDAALASITASGNYTVTLYKDQTLGAKILNTTDQNITLVSSATGIANERTIQYSGAVGSSMFTLQNAATILTLGNNITIKGINNSTTDILSVKNGTLTMLNGSKITGHYTAYHDVISVNGENASFIMSGGSITGNASSYNVGSAFSGGIYLGNGAVKITGGSIKENTPADIAFAPFPNSTTAFNLSGSAEIGVIMLDNSESDPFISLPGAFTGNVAALHIRSNSTDTVNAVITKWAGKQIIQAVSGYALTPADIAKFTLGNFYKSSTPISSQAIGFSNYINASGVLVAKTVYNIGNTGPAGGIIIYVNPNGFTVEGYGNSGDEGYFAEYTAYYLEAAPANASASAMRWSNTNILIPNLSQNNTETTDRAIGRGRLNTALIIAAHPDDTNANNAAKAATAYSGGGKNDWFLPSREELNQIYIQRSHVGITEGNFWSSSQRDSDNAWYQSFALVNQASINKGNDTRVVCAVRAF